MLNCHSPPVVVVCKRCTAACRIYNYVLISMQYNCYYLYLMHPLSHVDNFICLHNSNSISNSGFTAYATSKPRAHYKTTSHPMTLCSTCLNSPSTGILLNRLNDWFQSQLSQFCIIVKGVFILHTHINNDKQINVIIIIQFLMHYVSVG